MIKVCLHTENFSPGAMTHHVKNIAKYINKNVFEVFLAGTNQVAGSYFNEVARYIKPENILLYERSGKWYDYDPVGGDYYQGPDQHVLYDWIKAKRIDIIHDQRGGGSQFPLSSQQIDIAKIDSNIFGGVTGVLDGLQKTICISQGVYNEWFAGLNRRGLSQYSHLGTVLYPAIDLPETDQDMRKELGIGEDVVVMGRSSMGYAGDTYNYIAYKQIESPKTLFITPFLNDTQRELVKKLDIKNIIILPMIRDYDTKSRFYNTFDVAIHNRGESFGASVAEAMIHGKPVVTTGWCLPNNYNASSAQIELVEDINYIARGSTEQEVIRDYTKILQRLVFKGRVYCRNEGKAFKRRAEEKFAAPLVVKKLEDIYVKVFKVKYPERRFF